MKVVVIGAGLMGPTLAKDCVESEDVDEVLLIDIDEDRLSYVKEWLGHPSKLKTRKQSVLERSEFVSAIKGYDVAAVALPMMDPYKLIENSWWGARAVDFYDVEKGITSMAKTTSYTAAIVARMLGNNRIASVGISQPAHVIRGELMKELIDELGKRGVVVKHYMK